MTITEAKKRFSGFTRWHNKLCPAYKCSKSTLMSLYFSELLNTGSIELCVTDGTKDGCAHIWR